MFPLPYQDTTQIEVIRKTVAASSCELLDRRPAHPDKAGGTLDLLTSTDPAKVYHADIPLNSVSGMHRSDFWCQGQTFRDILQWDENKRLGIHGRGWQPDIFEYMEGELREKGFPAHASLYQMRLISRGGIVDCENGNHRFVATYCWLAAKYGDQATFRKVHVTHHPISQPLLNKLVELNRDSYKIDVLYQNDRARRNSVILRALRGRDVLHLGYNPILQNFSIERSQAPTLLSRLKTFFKSEQNEGWHSVSDSLIKRMAAASWARSTTLELLDELHRPILAPV